MSNVDITIVMNKKVLSIDVTLCEQVGKAWMIVHVWYIKYIVII